MFTTLDFLGSSPSMALTAELKVVFRNSTELHIQFWFRCFKYYWLVIPRVPCNTASQQHSVHLLFLAYHLFLVLLGQPWNKCSCPRGEAAHAPCSLPSLPHLQQIQTAPYIMGNWIKRCEAYLNTCEENIM